MLARHAWKRAVPRRIVRCGRVRRLCDRISPDACHLAPALAARRLVVSGLISFELRERFASALFELLPEWNYPAVTLKSEEAGLVLLVRSECVRLAEVLQGMTPDSTGFKGWLALAVDDPLPEVRFATAMHD